MKKLLISSSAFALSLFLFSLSFFQVSAQNSSPAASTSTAGKSSNTDQNTVGRNQTTASNPSSDQAKPKRPPIFRANKDQIIQAQTKLKEKALYTGETTGKLDTATREALKKFQSSNGLKPTGTLNRATLEKLEIPLTDRQKEIPVSQSSYAAENDKSTPPQTPGESKRPPIFRASREQVVAAQTLLKNQQFYNGEATGKLDDATREALRKYQQANGLKVTGTLNKITLEKMGISLTEKQRAVFGN